MVIWVVISGNEPPHTLFTLEDKNGKVDQIISKITVSDLEEMQDNGYTPYKFRNMSKDTPTPEKEEGKKKTGMLEAISSRRRATALGGVTRTNVTFGGKSLTVEQRDELQKEQAEKRIKKANTYVSTMTVELDEEKKKFEPLEAAEAWED